MMQKKTAGDAAVFQVIARERAISAACLRYSAR
jgi:hypothetical protein